MEATGGEPDVIGQDREARQYTFCDCSAESPIGRRRMPLSSLQFYLSKFAHGVPLSLRAPLL
jgi:hypothetical protein